MKIERVVEIKYLGVMISSNGNTEKDIEARIGSAVRMIGGMSEAVLQKKELSRKTKLSHGCYIVTHAGVLM